MSVMKKWLALALALVMLCAALPVSAEEAGATTRYLKDCGDCIKLMGRAEITDLGLVPHTTASGFAFYFDGSGDIELTVTGSSNIFDAQYFIVYVDGEMGNRLTLDHAVGRQETKTFKAAEGLSAGMHRIEIYRETEEINAECVFNSITLDGEMYPVPDAPLMIEFVGDSITTGYGAYPVTDESVAKGREDHPIRQAGTKSYAFLTAQALGTDFQACCTSGYGVEVGYNTDGVNMQMMYDKTAFHHDSTALWSFDRKADVVVINLGTNDSGARYKNTANVIPESQIIDGMENLISIVKEKNPDAKIVWVTGMMGKTFEISTKLLIKKLGGAEKGYYFCVLPQGTSGGGGHPDESQHAAAAEVLTEFLKEDVLGEEYAADYTTAEAAQTLVNSGTLTDTYQAMLQLEIDIAAKTDTPDGLLDGLYREAQANGIKTEADKESTDGGDTATVIVLVVVAAVALVGVVLFAVLYKPKKKSTEGGEE